MEKKINYHTIFSREMPILIKLIFFQFYNMKTAKNAE